MPTPPIPQFTPDEDPASLVSRQLAEHPFLAGLSAKHLGVLAACAMPSRFEAGERLFREGDPANRFYLVIRGGIAVESSRGNETKLIQLIGANDVLGWSWLYPPYLWHFDARAVVPTEVVFIYGTRLRELCEEDTDLGYALMKRTTNILIERLMATRRELTEKK